MKNYLLYLMLLFFAATIPHESTSQNIRVQLKWWHQFQFAGYYAAEIKGYYKAAGLSVTLIPGDKNKSPINEVINKNADYGVSGSEILINYLNGAPIQVIAAIFQHSPYVIISPVKKHILSPKDLIGKKIMIPDAQAWVQLKAILIGQGIDPATISVIPHSWNNNDILNDRADAMSGYISVEVLQLEKAGEKLNLLKPADYGVDFYGDVLFALKSTIKSKVHITDKF